MRSIVSLLLISTFGTLSGCQAFVRPNPRNVAPFRYGVLVFLAKKKRRRRASPSADSSIPTSKSDLSMDLPDFDLNEDDEKIEETSSKPMKNVDISKINPDEITPNMMAQSASTIPTGSINDLLADRSLESKFEFEEPEDESIPDFVDLAQASGGDIPDPTKMSSKQTRKAKAIAAAKAEQEERDANKNPLADLPFVTNEKGEVQSIKFLEAGAWAGIFLLVSWEVYLNSPFFERAAPLAPVVYDVFLK